MKRKLLFAAMFIAGALGQLRAQTVPAFQEKNDFSGTVVSQLSTFVPSGTTYTLELEGCVSDQQITVPGGSFSYTPTTSGTVRFVRFGSTVYVYEGTTYKGTVAVSTPSAPTYPDIYGAADNSSDGTGIYNSSNLFKNPGFETLGDKLANNQYKAVNWDANGYTYSNRSRVRDNANLNGQEGSCTFLIHGYGNPADNLSQELNLDNFTPYQVKFKIWFHEGAACTYTATVGTAVGNGSLYSGEVSTPSSGSADRSFTFTTDALTASNYYFTLTRKTSSRLGNFDRMTMVAANGGGIGITGATGATFLPGSAYAPEGVLAAALANDGSADATLHIVNPSFETGNTNGWTTLNGSDVGAKLNSNETYTTSGADGNYVFNIWGGTAPYKVSQTLTGLPDGYYQLTALIASDANQYIQVYCGNGKVYDTSADKGTGKDITTAVAYVSGGSVEIGATSYNWFKCDNFRLTYLGSDFTPSSETPLALTDKASLAWNVGGTTVQWGIQLREVYSTDPTTIANDVLTQTISGLDNGNYRVKLWAEASYAKNNGVADSDVAEGTHVATLYANDATANVNLENQTGVAGGTLNSYTLDAQVTTHTLKIGMNAIASGANWKIIQIENLLYTGPLDLSSYIATYNGLVSEAGTAKSTYTGVLGKELTDLNAALDETFDTSSPDAYDDINGRLRSLIDAFVAAAPNYALLETEKTKASNLGMSSASIAEVTPLTKTGLRALQDLKEAEYTYVTTEYSHGVELGAWTSTGNNTSAADFNNEHWSGTTHSYKNQNDTNGQGWNANSWSINFSQNVTLPAGNYVFKVAGRQASGDQVTTSLVVTNTANSAVLGSISDFPRSNNARGINKDGATSFNEDASAYANGGNGFGWEWRYVKFTLADDAVVNIAINSVATASHQWVSFGDYTLQTDNEANISMIAYNIALNNARTVLADATYTNVAGTDKSNLEDAIDADESLDKNDADAIDAATETLNNAATTFTAGVASWNAYALAKGYADAISAVALPYATSAKIEAVATAKNATVNTAANAATQAGTINTANRAAYESNAIAENVPGKARTNLITNADGSNVAVWSGEFRTASNESFTDAAGSSENTYFDKNNVKSFTTSQTIKLPKGTYILSVTARAQAGINSYKMQVTNNASETEEVTLTAMGNQNGVFNRGWNDFFVVFEQKAFGDATISIIGDNTTNNANFWMSWDRFRLYCIGGEGAYELDEDVAFTPVSLEGIDVTLTRSFSTSNWATFVVPFDIDEATLKDQFGDGVKVCTISANDKTGVSFSDVMAEPSITANTPVIMKVAKTAASYSFNGVEIEVPLSTATNLTTGVDIVANYGGEITIPSESGYSYYYVKSNNLYKSTGTQKTKGFRAYFKVSDTAPVKAFFDNGFNFDGTDAVKSVEAVQDENAVIYNLSGQRVGKAQKGLYIVNGKKVMVK